jgi:CrcB protein
MFDTPKQVNASPAQNTASDHVRSSDVDAGAARGQPDADAHDIIARVEPKPPPPSGRRCCATAALWETGVAVAILAIPGCLVRSALGDASSAPMQGYILPNFIGSALIAVAAANRASMERVHTSLYTGFTTGFCGSLTTLSAWQQTAVSAITGLPDADECSWGSRSPNSTGILGGRFYAWLELILIGLAVGLVGYDFGCHLGVRIRKRYGKSSEIPSNPIRRHSCYQSCQPCGSNTGRQRALLALLALGTTCALVAGAVVDGSPLAFTLLLAPVGACVRWLLSFANTTNVHFPWGTFVANVTGSVIMAVLSVIMRIHPINYSQMDGNDWLCPVLAGLAVGFCGSLTTVSTWVSELRKLEPASAWVYGVVTIVSAQVLMAVVISAALAETSEFIVEGTCMWPSSSSSVNESQVGVGDS